MTPYSQTVGGYVKADTGGGGIVGGYISNYLLLYIRIYHIK